MTKEERKIRFDVALEIVQKVFTDYCKDQDVSREERHDFNDVVLDMIRFSSVLGKESKKK